MPLKKILLATALIGTSAFAASASAAVATANFQVQITIQKACSVTTNAASNINFGTVASTAVNTPGTSSISVICSKTTPYYIGLAPSNNTTTGAGVMSGTGSNTDKVPYQLNSVSNTGPVWGNTATATTVGNGVAGTGTGLAQSISVYATVPNANFTPDTYTDTVTVNVNY